MGRRDGQWHGLVFIDLDGFKALNDRHGHQEGDRYLLAVGQRLSRAQRETDCVARLGGDEFVVLCPHLGRSKIEARQALQAVETKLRSALALPWEVHGDWVPMGASVGSCAFSGNEGSAEDILLLADRRMYADKKSRRRSSGLQTLALSEA